MSESGARTAWDMHTAFPAHLEARVTTAGRLLTPGSYQGDRRLIQDSYAQRWGDVMVSGEKLLIPYRHYDTASSSSIGADQVLAAWMTRSNDGRPRQRALESLLAGPPTEWQPAYVIQLLGEYVIEICEVIADHVDEMLPRDSVAREAYRGFSAANPRFIALTRARCASYFNAYHYRVTTWAEHPGRRALDAIELMARKAVSP